MMDKDRESLELVTEALARFEEMLEQAGSLEARHIDQQEETLEQARAAIAELLEVLNTHAAPALTSRVAVRNESPAHSEDHRKRLNRESQAVLYPRTELYGNKLPFRLYK